VRDLEADCHSAVGALAVPGELHGLVLRAWVGATDGSAWVTDELRGDDPEALGTLVAGRLLAAGAGELLGP
jgi:hydroxymethylbilane synthase